MSKLLKRVLSVVAVVVGCAIVLGAVALSLYVPPAPATTPAESAVAAKASALSAQVSATMKANYEVVTLRPLPRGAKVLVVGDSFTQGFGTTTQETDNYARLLADGEGWDAKIDGVGGSGYSWGGGKDGKGGLTFVERLRDLHAPDRAFTPDLVIFQGSSNDYRAKHADLIRKIEETVEFTRTTWPKTQVVILGPSLAHPNGNNIREMNGAITRAAIDAKVPFIDVLTSHWLTAENSPGFAFTDGSHLTTPGHVFLASKIAEALDAKTTKP